MGKLHRELSKGNFMLSDTLFRLYREFLQGEALSLGGEKV